jgi:hypothetical protein
MLARASCEDIKQECRQLWQEVKGYAKLFSSIISSLQKENSTRNNK